MAKYFGEISRRQPMYPGYYNRKIELDSGLMLAAEDGDVVRSWATGWTYRWNDFLKRWESNGYCTYSSSSSSVETKHMINRLYGSEAATKRCSDITIEKIFVNGNSTTVVFDDGVKTTVTMMKDDGPFDVYSAVAQAVCKRVYGNGKSGTFHKYVDNHVVFQKLKEEKKTKEAK